MAHQNFGAGAHHLKITKIVEIHVRRRIQRTQRTVQAQGRFGVALLNALAHLHLHEIARGNQLLGALHGCQIVILGKAALSRVAVATFDLRHADRVAQLLLELAHALLGLAVGLGLCRVGVNNEIQLAREVVDHRHLFAQQQHDVGRAQRIGRAGGFEFFLDIAHRVIAKVPGQTTAKTRQAGAECHLEALLVRGNEVQRIARVAFHHHTIGQHIGFGRSAKTAGTQASARRQANKAVAAKTLTTHHRLQQEAVFAVTAGMRQLEVQRQRGFKVSKRLGHQGNTVVAFAGQAFEFKFCNHRAGFPIGARTAPKSKGQACNSLKPSAAVADKGAPAMERFKRSLMQAYARARLPGPRNL